MSPTKTGGCFKNNALQQVNPAERRIDRALRAGAPHRPAPCRIRHGMQKTALAPLSAGARQA